MYRYAEVEAALAAMHHVLPEMLDPFRARLKNFRKLGVVPSSPGKGRKIEYTFQDAATWAFCLELTEIGLDPTTVREAFVDTKGVALANMAAHDGEDRIMFFNLNLWMQWGRGSMGFGWVPSQVCSISEATFDRMSAGWAAGQTSPTASTSRVVAINLSRIGRELRGALERQCVVPAGGIFG